MNYQLICEGVCNPGLPVADALVRQFADAKHRQVAFDNTDRMIAAQRKLIYTEHAIVDGRTVECVRCKTKRRFGA